MWGTALMLFGMWGIFAGSWQGYKRDPGCAIVGSHGFIGIHKLFWVQCDSS
jgi:hypothetical protein